MDVTSLLLIQATPTLATAATRASVGFASMLRSVIDGAPETRATQSDVLVRIGSQLTHSTAAAHNRLTVQVTDSGALRVTGTNGEQLDISPELQQLLLQLRQQLGSPQQFRLSNSNGTARVLMTPPSLESLF